MLIWILKKSTVRRIVKIQNQNTYKKEQIILFKVQRLIKKKKKKIK